MDRITYISAYGSDVTPNDIYEIGRKSQLNNSRDSLTGALLCLKGVFYQIIEGEKPQLYKCFSRIQADPRHSDIFILNIEKDIKTRLYGQWNMETVVLDEQTGPLMTPIRNLLNSLTRTHQTLKKYAPLEILNGIQNGMDPLTWGLKRDELVVVFSDLIGFSTLTEETVLKELQDILDTYFGLAFLAIENSGGTISKITGDGFMAYYPVSQANLALEASLEIVRALKKKRSTTKSPFMKLSYCVFGLSAGHVVKGNIGSAVKKDYTVLGDVVNSASRLESHTRQTGHSILFDHRFKRYLTDDSGLSTLELGDFTPKGKSRKMQIYTVNDPDATLDRSADEIAGEIRAIGK